MTDKPMTFEGIPIVFEPSFETDPQLRNRCYLIPQISADELLRAEAKLGRALSPDEVLSVLIHRSACIVLDEEAKP